MYALVLLDEITLLADLSRCCRPAATTSACPDSAERALSASEPCHRGGVDPRASPLGPAGFAAADASGRRLAAGVLVRRAGRRLRLGQLLAAWSVFGAVGDHLVGRALRLSDSAGLERPRWALVISVAGIGGRAGPAFAGVLADRVSRGAPF
jgi:hypothetical protein